MNNIVSLMKNLAPKEGLNKTNLEDVTIFKTSSYRHREPLCYKQGLMFIGQGKKRVYLDEKVYEYDQDNYLLMSVPLPAECETISNEDEPVLLLMIEFDYPMLSQIVSQINEYRSDLINISKVESVALTILPRQKKLNELLLKLLKCLQNPLESKVLGHGFLKELMFYILCQKESKMLYSLLTQNSNLSRIDKALKLIHNNYNKILNVENLAKIAGMSSSSFHRNFKELTASSPIQYIKKIRLDKARTLLIQKDYRVTEVAKKVGYESSSQFSREFKRYFAVTPADYAKSIKTKEN
ncbi:AraC family transcriptional regulator [Lentisphaerota bacterium WC36G]|nr:AraC family transcriptional regulator [Lentisphaerae bacterium WC36]